MNRSSEAWRITSADRLLHGLDVLGIIIEKEVHEFIEEFSIALKSVEEFRFVKSRVSPDIPVGAASSRCGKPSKRFSMVWYSSWVRMGLGRYPSIPSAKQRSRLPAMACAVMATMGMCSPVVSPVL